MKLVSHAEVQAAGPGGTLHLDPDAVLTPLAEDEARRLGVSLHRAGSPVVPASLVRQVTRQVVSRLGDASPEVLEAVIGEVIGALGQQQPAATVEKAGQEPGESMGLGIDFCQLCLESERARTRRRAVLTTTGRNQKGIVAKVTSRIFEQSGDILDISQTLVGDYFTMIIVVDTGTLGVSFGEFKASLEETVRELGLQSMMMHEDVVSALHRI